MGEKELQKEVLRLMRQNGWLVCHFGNTVKLVRSQEGILKTVPDKNGAGFPDIIAIRDGRIIVAELKGDHGHVTSEQQNWLDHFDTAKVDTYIWRPKDWPDRIYKAVKR